MKWNEEARKRYKDKKKKEEYNDLGVKVEQSDRCRDEIRIGVLKK
jgi:hypothetical protein